MDCPGVILLLLAASAGFIGGSAVATLAGLALLRWSLQDVRRVECRLCSATWILTPEQIDSLLEPESFCPRCGHLEYVGRD